MTLRIGQPAIEHLCHSAWTYARESTQRLQAGSGQRPLSRYVASALGNFLIPGYSFLFCPMSRPQRDPSWNCTMPNVQDFPKSSTMLTEYEALVAAAPNALDAIPGAVYLCDHKGYLVRYNTEAAELWGRVPTLTERNERFCGSHRLFLLDGTLLL